MMYRSLPFIIFCLSILIFSCGNRIEKEKSPPAIAELEPNNSIEEAMSIIPDKIFQGHINEKLDQDWYLIAMPDDSSAILRAALTGIDDINLKMELFDPDKKLLLDINRLKEGEGEIITNYLLNPGKTYLRVRELWLKNQEKKFSDSLAYHLNIQLSKLNPGAELEPNNKSIQATFMSPNVEMEGYISPYNDVDWYRLPLTKEENSYLVLTLSGIENVDAKLKVYDPIEAVIYSADKSGKGGEEKIINLGVDPEREFYYVVVEGGKWQTDENMPYRLSAVFKNSRHPLEFEPNDRFEIATSLVDGDSICGFIDSGSDVDWYHIATEPTEKKIARIELKGVPKVDFKMTLTDEWEEPILIVDEKGMQENEYITNLGIAEGDRYFLKLESLKKGYNVEKQYSVFLKLRSSFKSEEFELNNDKESANKIEVTKTMEGYIHPLRDVDFYRFDFFGRYTAKIQIILSGIMKVNTDMTLYDESMNELSTAALKGPEGIERLTFDAVPGTYYIKVYDNDGKESNYRDKYRLALFEQR